jgi:hypothetical protein
MLLLLFLLLVVHHSARLASVTLVQQSNLAQNDTLDDGNRTICRNFTDLYHSPVLWAVDDFNLPPLSETTRNCSLLQLQFDTVVRRNGYDQAQLSVTVQFLSDENGVPATTLFQKTVPLPTDFTSVLLDVGGGARMLTLLPLTINFSEGEYNDAGAFSLDTLRAHRRLWVGFYVNGPRNFNWANRTENQVYWALQHRASASALLLNLVPNLDYFYRDTNNLLGVDLGNWSNATVTEQALNLQASSHNMAWQALLWCYADETAQPTAFNDTAVTTTEEPPFSNGTVIALGTAILLGMLLLFGIFIWTVRAACNCLRRRHGKKRTETYELPETHFVSIDESENSIVGLEPVSSEIDMATATGNNTSLWMTESDQSDHDATTKQPDPRQAVRQAQAQAYIDKKKNVALAKKND